MEVKEIKDGKIILVEKDKKLTYEDIVNKIFPIGAFHYFIDENIVICKIENVIQNYKLSNNALSQKQLEKLLAINQLMNVAKYLNGDWKPDWDSFEEIKYHIIIYEDKIEIESIACTRDIDVYFKSRELAKQAIEILGEDIIRLAFCDDY